MKFLAGLTVGVVIAIAACSKSEEKASGTTSVTIGPPNIVCVSGCEPSIPVFGQTYMMALAHGRTETGKTVLLQVDDEGRVSCK